MESLSGWFQSHADTLQKFGVAWVAIGVISLVITIISLPVIIVRLPADYFVRERRVRLLNTQLHPVLGWGALALKNLVGLALLVLGAVMLFVPGQGVLTMLIGLMLMNFPGKYRLEQRLVRRPAVLRTLNRIRNRWQRPPLLAPDDERH